jgi:hypothetical protein
MDHHDAFPAEMPGHPFHPIPPLDDPTAERLLAGRLDPQDAPPSYAKVAALLRAASAPPEPHELAGAATALATFRTTRTWSPAARRRLVPVRHGMARVRAWRGPVRARLVAVVMAGTLAAGAVVAGGLWTAGSSPPGDGLRSPTGGPGTGGSGSGVPGAGGYGSGVPGAGGYGPGGYGFGTPGSLGSARPTTGPVTAGAGGDGAGPGVDGRTEVLPSARERATARRDGGGSSRGGGSVHGVRPGKPPKAKQPKAKPVKDGNRDSDSLR